MRNFTLITKKSNKAMMDFLVSQFQFFFAFISWWPLNLKRKDKWSFFKSPRNKQFNSSVAPESNQSIIYQLVTDFLPLFYFYEENLFCIIIDLNKIIDIFDTESLTLHMAQNKRIHSLRALIYGLIYMMYCYGST